MTKQQFLKRRYLTSAEVESMGITEEELTSYGFKLTTWETKSKTQFTEWVRR